MKNISISPHCLLRMKERNISLKSVKATIASPDQVIKSGKRKVLQKKIKIGNKQYLMKVIQENQIILTVYKTSKIEK